MTAAREDHLAPGWADYWDQKAEELIRRGAPNLAAVLRETADEADRIQRAHLIQRTEDATTISRADLIAAGALTFPKQPGYAVVDGGRANEF